MLRHLFRQFAFLPPQSATDNGRLTVVMDLDETLCHVFYPQEATGFQYQPDIKEDAIIEFKAQKTVLYVYKRPNLDSFLDFLDKNYEPVLWSSGTKEYVDLVADAIDPKRIFRHRLYQEHCDYERPIGYPQFEFVKDIRKLRDDISRVVVVEDDWQGLYKHPDNFLHLEKFEAWFQDDWLEKKIPKVLKEVEKLEDVRPYLRAKFMFKYSWAEQKMLFELTPQDLKMAEFIVKNGIKDYEKLKIAYDRLFSPRFKYITADKLW
jgi:carboxy-terminal domain RNA polymerase II polypeptide A small phosphatase